MPFICAICLSSYLKFINFTAMKRHLIFSLILVVFSTKLFAQQKTVANTDSTLLLHYDERYDLLVNKLKEQNVNNQSMQGYRIQIYFGGVRQKASEVKIDFTSKFPEMAAYISYQQPNFKVRVGDFRTRFEAQRFLKQLEGQYPTMFIVPDEVKLPSVK